MWLWLSYAGLFLAGMVAVVLYAAMVNDRKD